MEKFRRVNRETVYKGVILDFCRDDIITPDGKEVYWDYLRHNGASATVAVTNENKILMVRQWRNAIDRFALEIPAGARREGEDPKDCAVRELEEETGYRAFDVEFLKTVVPAIAYSGEKIDVYVAKDLRPSRQHLDPDEQVEILEFTVEELVEKINSDEIQDSKTISAILAYYLKYCGK